ncbi:hypothetical protein L7F22_028233 [Adiantum nelumboides]|nr:hypothetical protein [Adiantum nelumboides]
MKEEVTKVIVETIEMKTKDMVDSIEGKMEAKKKGWVKNSIVALAAELAFTEEIILCRYAESQVLTPKVDVYAFGIVLLEIFSGRAVVSQHSGRQPQHLADWAKGHVEQGNIHEVLKASFDGHYDLSAAWKVVGVALRCVEFESRKRPNMSEVCSELKAALSMELHGEEMDSSTSMTIDANITGR